MSKYQSAGVYPREIDLSTIVTTSGSSVGAVVGSSERGSVNERVLITNTKDMVSRFGKPDLSYGYMIHTAIAFLEKSNQIYVTRVVSADAKHAAIKVGKSAHTSDTIPVTGGLSVADLSSDLFASDTNSVFLIRAENPGVWGSSLKVRVEDIDATEATFSLTVIEIVDGVDIVREIFTDCSRQQGVDGFGRSKFIEDRVNDGSDYIRIHNNGSVADTELPKEITTEVSLADGSTGSATSESDVIAGWRYYENKDDVEVNILLNAGYVTDTSFAVQSKLKSLAEDRRDCFAILDAPYSELDATELVDWRKTTQNFNSSHVALYGPWIEVYNAYKGQNIIMPPSGFVGAVFADVDSQREPWYAPAGTNYGLIDSGNLSPVKLTESYKKGEQDLLYSNGVNFLRSIPGSGLAIWGQKTQQRKASALDRVNVRRLIIVVEKAIETYLKNIVFELNDQFTRTQVTEAISNFMDQIQARRGVYEYQVVCDETNNTPQIIDQNQMNVDVYLKPTRVAEYLQLQTIITPTGANISELVNAV